MTSGILCVRKPKGFTSFDVVAKMRGILKTRKIGHAGTLDPMAEGVLPIFVEGATKACDIMPENTKAYSASFKLGLTTDTQDITGNVIGKCECTSDENDVREKLKNFSGSIEQIPPMYSAVSVGGKRLYELARQGIEVERKPRKIFIEKAELVSYDPGTAEGIIKIVCSKGTYVRTIIHDLGQLLGCGAVMTALVRTSSNGFSLDECFTLEEIQKYADEGRADELILPVERVFESLEKIKLSPSDTVLYKNGVKLSCKKFGLEGKDENTKYRVFSDENIFLGLCFIKDGAIRVFKNFNTQQNAK